MSTCSPIWEWPSEEVKTRFICHTKKHVHMVTQLFSIATNLLQLKIWNLTRCRHPPSTSPYVIHVESIETANRSQHLQPFLKWSLLIRWGCLEITFRQIYGRDTGKIRLSLIRNRPQKILNMLNIENKRAVDYGRVRSHADISTVSLRSLADAWPQKTATKKSPCVRPAIYHT